MFLHKLHVNQIYDTCHGLHNVLTRMSNSDYKMWTGDIAVLQNGIKAFKDFEKHLEDVNKHVVNEETELKQIQHTILNKEHADQKDKDYLEKIIPELTEGVLSLEKKVLELNELLKLIYEKGNRSQNAIDSARELLLQISKTLVSIKHISEEIARMLNNEYSDVEKEILMLKKEEKMIGIFRHNMDSWFFH
ncbi:MAG: hypothetical protein ABH828_00180 [archaeon]